MAGVNIPYPKITGLTDRQSYEIWRNFQALAGQFGGAGGGSTPSLPASVRFVVGARNGKLATSPDGTTWTARTSSFGTDDIKGVVWGPEAGLFVAVGAAGKLATSPDGIVWTQGSSGTSESLNAVTYSSTLGFLAVGDNNTMRVSTNGSSWSSVAAPSFGASDDLAYACWSSDLGIFVATGAGKLATSPDGTTWTQRSVPAGLTPKGVIWNGALARFHVCGSAGGSSSHGYSLDGVTWTKYGTDPTNSSAGPAGFASSTQSLIATGGESGTLDTSPDGTTWTARTVSSIHIFTDLDYSEALGLFVAVGYNFGATTTYIATSPDGATWTGRTVPFPSDAIECVCAADLS